MSERDESQNIPVSGMNECRQMDAVRLTLWLMALLARRFTPLTLLAATVVAGL